MAARFPEWIRRNWASGNGFTQTKDILQDLSLHTVCQSARCPNQGECWKRQTATFMILGNVCTRHCAFCSVQAGDAMKPDATEPEHVAEAVKRLGLKHAVVTSVTRDDLPDGGAGHFATTVNAIRAKNPTVTVEVLTPDFRADTAAISTLVEARPDVFGHNIETVRRLYASIRDTRAAYDRSLAVLRTVAEKVNTGSIIVKSGLMVGHGETPEEIRETLHDLHAAGCSAVTIGQYLRPGRTATAVAEYVHPDQFRVYEQMAYEEGFAFAVAAPFVRSSYHSEEVLTTLRTGK